MDADDLTVILTGFRDGRESARFFALGCVLASGKPG
jgi:hypothetical protein